MPRPERPLDQSGPLAEFAQALRELRKQSELTYAEMAERVGVSKTVLSQAASGRRLPTWEATRAYVTACGEDEASWRPRWEHAERQWRSTQARHTPQPAAPQPRNEPLDGPAQRLARDLGRLRRAAGRDFRDLAAQIGRPPNELVAIVQGKAFPDWAVTRDFVLACRGSLPQWRQRWEQAMRWRLRQHDSATRDDPTPEERSDRASDDSDWSLRLATVSSRSEFATVLRELRQRSGLTYGSIEELSGLPTSTISDMLGARTLPSEATLNAFLKTLGVHGRATWRWMAARERVQMSRTVLPATATRVSNVHARTLGLHTAMERHLEQPMPSYIGRDVDQQLRLALGRANRNGGFLLVTGGPAAGKTRSTFEAVANALPDWWLVRPYDAEQLVSLAKAPDQNTVVWLDELQRYGTDESFLHALRTLLECDRAVLLVGIVRLEQYQRFLAGLDRGRELLDLNPDIVTVPQRLTPAEWLRAHRTSLDDPRVEVALKCHDHGTFQVLAAGPELVHRWKLASNRFGAALISVAVDARRLGVTTGLPARLLREAAYGYLSRAERAVDPAGWFADALAYVTTPLLSEVAALTPVVATGATSGTSTPGAPAGIGGDDRPDGTGYLVADYLVQHDEKQRPTVLPPDSAWEAYLRHLDSANDLDTLAVSAERLGLDQYAEELARRAAVAGHADARRRLVERLERGQRFDEAETLLCQVADNGVAVARVELAELCERHGRFADAERHLVEAVARGTPRARQLLVRLLHRQMRVEELDAAVRAAVSAGEPGSRFLLAYVLDANGDTADAERLLREASDTNAAGAGWARGELLRLTQRRPTRPLKSGARHEQSLVH